MRRNRERGLSLSASETASAKQSEFSNIIKHYLEGKDEDEENEDDDSEAILPPLSTNQQLEFISMTGTERFSRPPSRFTEASLVKKLEELGIGRPSTYAPTISTKTITVEVPVKGKTDSYVPKQVEPPKPKTIFKKIFVSKPEYVYNTIEVPVKVDTAEILKAYYAKNYYSDTVKTKEIRNVLPSISFIILSYKTSSPPLYSYQIGLMVW